MTAALRVALYARVSTDRQAQAGTIESQVAALEQRILADGLPLKQVRRYLDTGYSGSVMQRPGLDQLRDASAAGLLDRLYLLEPDRLARTFVHQWLLQEEFRAAGVELVWVGHHPATMPEEQLLVQIQGSVAQYERTKILERCRRGRRHAAQQGAVHALCAAPYGYRYITKAEGGGQARYEIDLVEARVVRQIFAWVAEERCSTVEVVRRLAEAGIPTRTGKPRWQRPTIHDLLTNPAYRGEAAFGRQQRVREEGRLSRVQGPQRLTTPEADWILIPVPPLVSADLFAAAPGAAGDRGVSAHRVGAVRELWERLGRAPDLEGSAQRAAGVRLLPLSRDRSATDRGRAGVSESRAAHGPGRRDRVAGGVPVAG